MEHHTMNHPTHHRSFYTAIFSLVIAIFIILIAAVLALRSVYDIPVQIFSGPADVTVSPTVSLRKGSLTLTTKNGQIIYGRGETIALILTADSDNRSITGYDAVISYDSTMVRFVKATNLEKDFQTFVKKSEGTINFTGVKKLDASAPSVFAQTPIAEFVFTVQSGAAIGSSVPFNLAFVPGSTQDSNLIDEASAEILGIARGTTVRVGEK